ncbi:MAG: peroxiredoxin [Candidatus Glassbacteria bacterium]|nr:peroxiredoxin [Candidatus Glassbacteria bacterium]
MVKAGDKAPGFALQNQDDREVTLDSLKGKWVVLYFYPKDNTPGCTTEACDFTARRNEFSGLDAVVVGVSPDSTSSHRGFIEKQGLNLVLLSDPEHVALEAYGAWKLKKNYGREYMGVQRSTFLIGPDGTIAHAWPNVIAKGHVEKVKEKLAELKG